MVTTDTGTTAVMAAWTWVQPVRCICFGAYEEPPPDFDSTPSYLPPLPTCRNTQIVDTCIVFKQWHISSRFAFVLSFTAIIFLSLGYEYLRAYQRIVDQRIALILSRGNARDNGRVSGRSSPELSGPDVEEAGLLSGRPKKLATG